MLRKQDWNIWEMPPTSINVTVDKNTGKTIDIQHQPSLRQYTAPIQAYPPAVFTGENLVLPNIPKQSKENDKGFDVLKSTATNILSDAANRLPEAIKNEGYYKGFLSGYIKAGGAVSGTLTLMDMKQDWNTYNGGKLVFALGTDILPLYFAVKGVEFGATMGSEAGLSVLTGAWGGIGGAILGDFVKHGLRYHILQEK